MKQIKKVVKRCIFIFVTLLFIIGFLGYTNLGNLSIGESPQNSFLKINDETIRFSQNGKGKDILLIHGTPGSIEDWIHIVDTLSKNFRVTSFDRFGHGFSSSNNYTYHLKDNAELVEKLIKKLQLKDPLIIGHSYGGSTAAQMAVNSRNKNLRYIIIDSPLYEYSPSKIYQLVATPILGKGIALLSSFTIANTHIKKGVSPLFKFLEREKAVKLIEERQRLWSQPKVIYSKSKESVHYISDLNLISNQYKNIDSKITVITGRDSITTFRNDCEKFHSEVLNSNLIIFDNVSHYIQFDKPKELVQIIKQNMN